jgi:hypothetical protein
LYDGIGVDVEPGANLCGKTSVDAKSDANLYGSTSQEAKRYPKAAAVSPADNAHASW